MPAGFAHVARVERADPDQVISNSLKLQAMKLATVRTLLRSPDPPTWGDMDPALRKKASDLLWLLHREPDGEGASAAWESLRGIINAPGLPTS